MFHVRLPSEWSKRHARAPRFDTTRLPMMIVVIDTYFVIEIRRSCAQVFSDLNRRPLMYRKPFRGGVADAKTRRSPRQRPCHEGPRRTRKPCAPQSTTSTSSWTAHGRATSLRCGPSLGRMSCWWASLNGISSTRGAMSGLRVRPRNTAIPHRKKLIGPRPTLARARRNWTTTTYGSTPASALEAGQEERDRS